MISNVQHIIANGVTRQVKVLVLFRSPTCELWRCWLMRGVGDSNMRLALFIFARRRVAGSSELDFLRRRVRPSNLDHRSFRRGADPRPAGGELRSRIERPRRNSSDCSMPGAAGRQDRRRQCSVHCRRVSPQARRRPALGVAAPRWPLELALRLARIEVKHRLRLTAAGRQQVRDRPHKCVGAVRGEAGARESKSAVNVQS